MPKLGLLSDNVGMAYSGMGPDSRVLLRKGRKVGQQYWMQYKDAIPVASMVRDLAAVMQEYTQSGGVRPFGVSLLVAGYDDLGPQLYQVDPSGSFWAWKASAIGRNMNNAKTFLEKRYPQDDPATGIVAQPLELEDAIHTTILTLKDGFEGAMNEYSIEIGVVTEDRVFRILTPKQVREYLDVLA